MPPALVRITTRLLALTSLTVAPAIAAGCSSEEGGVEPIEEVKLGLPFPPIAGVPIGSRTWYSTRLVDQWWETGSAEYTIVNGAPIFTLASYGTGLRIGDNDKDQPPPVELFRDAAQFVYTPLRGDDGEDIEIVVRVTTAAVNPAGPEFQGMMAGVMIREGTNSAGLMGAGFFKPDNPGAHCMRPLKEIGQFGVTTRAPLRVGATTNTAVVPAAWYTTRVKTPLWLRLQRVGRDYSVSRSIDGNTWVAVGGGEFAPLGNVNIGVFVGGQHNAVSDTTATFDNIYVGPVRNHFKTSFIGASFAKISTDFVSREMEGFYVSPSGESFKYAMTATEAGHNLSKIDAQGNPIPLTPQNHALTGVLHGGIAGDANYVYVVGDDWDHLGNPYVERRRASDLKPFSRLNFNPAYPLREVAGLAVGNNRIFVSDRTNNRIRVVEAGTLDETDKSFSFDRPGAIAVDHSGRLWIVHSPTQYPNLDDLHYRFANFFPVNPIRYTIDDAIARPTNRPGCPAFLPGALHVECSGALSTPSVECVNVGGGRCRNGGLLFPLITNVGNPTALAIGPNPVDPASANPALDKLYIADNGPEQRVRICTNLGLSMSCNTTFGNLGGALAGPIPGRANRRVAPVSPRFFGLVGVGVDAQDNLYVASSAPRVEIRKWSSSLQPLWSYHGLSPEPGAFDPGTDGQDFYTLTRHLKFDPAVTVPGAEWDLYGVTIDPFASYPDSERFFGTLPKAEAPMIRRLQGASTPFMFVRGPEDSRLRIYRFVGEIARPAGSVSYRNNNVVVWVDRNGDGRPTTDETTSRAFGPFHADVDARGNVWLHDTTTVWKIAYTSVLSNGVPDYAVVQTPGQTTWPMPPLGEGADMLRFDAAHGALYLFGAVSLPEHAQGSCVGDSPRRVVARYDRWEQQQTGHRASYVTALPDPRLTQNEADDFASEWADPVCTNCITSFHYDSFDVAGDFFFVANRQGQIYVYDARTGASVTTLSPGPELSGWGGDETDAFGMMQAFRRSTGEYLITNTDSSTLARTILYRFTPYQSQVIGLPCSQDQACVVPAGECGNLPGRATCTDTLLERCVAVSAACTVTAPGCGAVPGRQSCIAGKLVGQCAPKGQQIEQVFDPNGLAPGALHLADALDVPDFCDGINQDCDAQIDEDNPPPVISFTAQGPVCPGPSGTPVTLSPEVSDADGIGSRAWVASAISNGAYAPVIGTGPSLTTTITQQSPNPDYYTLTAADQCAAHPSARASTAAVNVVNTGCP